MEMEDAKVTSLSGEFVLWDDSQAGDIVFGPAGTGWWMRINGKTNQLEFNTVDYPEFGADDFAREFCRIVNELMGERQRYGDWISIATRKPKLDEDVLITNAHYVIKAHLGEWNVRDSEYEYGSLVWFSEECHPCVWPFSEGEVTHWMPLPEPPEVSNADH